MKLSKMQNVVHLNNYIYITINEYIGLSWYFDGNFVREGVIDDKDYWSVRPDYQKIIMTDDPKLIKAGIQSIPFVIEKSINFVKVNKISIDCSCSYQSKYKKNANIIKANTTCHERNNCKTEYKIELS